MAAILAACGSAPPSSYGTTDSKPLADHRCADLLAQAQVQLAPVPGVWRCLEPAVQATYSGTGDRMVIASGPFLAPATLIACDGNLCVYSLLLEAATAVKLGTPELTMTIWLDEHGLVELAGFALPHR